VYPGMSQLEGVQVSALVFASLFFSPISFCFFFVLVCTTCLRFKGFVVVVAAGQGLLCCGQD
jgi:hypothetical protein